MGNEVGKAVIVMICGSLVYYHCAFRNSSLLSLLSDVLIVLLCSLAILGLFFRQLNIAVPVDPLEWQISQDAANSIAACLANTVGAAESVLRVAATGHDKRLFLKLHLFISSEKFCSRSRFLWMLGTRHLSPLDADEHVVVCLYILSAIGRLLSGVTVAYAGLCLFCLYMLVESFPSSNSSISRLWRSGGAAAEQDNP
ncbi:reticulon-like protein B23 isoform X1 [Punica granatum]|uniref:Reticulon-like protein B23 isoform X1 n=1 Tax=Punica granatum TaxID=22663 RepID=A0A6P8C0Y2_PUNGR|nr:reticulon-like protein B23 isoform X1 [Punica granatum]